MKYTIEYEQEDDGRWLAEVKELPGVMAYGQTLDEAVAKVKALTLRVIADQIEHGEFTQQLVSISFAAAGVNGHLKKPNECWQLC